MVFFKTKMEFNGIYFYIKWNFYLYKCGHAVHKVCCV